MSLTNTLAWNINKTLGDLRKEGLLSAEIFPMDWSIGPFEYFIPSELEPVSPTKDSAHGDLTTNVALILSKKVGKPPRELASIIGDRLKKIEMVDRVEIAGPGFINVFLRKEFVQDCIKQILAKAGHYGDWDIPTGRFGKKVSPEQRKVNLEYVSANPTGPLHVGHVRGAVFGDALANLLEKTGYEVTREYYINDAGAQMDTLARSVYLRYLEALGEDIGDIPEGLYPGDYLVPVGQAFAKEFGDKFKNQEEANWLDIFREKGTAAMMDLIRADLEVLGIEQEVFFSESSLHTSGLVPEAIEFLRKKNVIYEGVLEPPKGKKPEGWEPREQTLFRSTDFGDDVDRPLVKSDGSHTYFASDIAYQFDKFKRGFKNLIVVVGADHVGYVKRLKAALSAMSGGEGYLDVRLCQMVKLYKGGAPFKMSKRAGTFVTLRELVDEVGPGVVRFIMLTRKNDAQLDFDFDKVTEQSRDNPVFYVQYAHARTHSAFRKAKEIFPELKTGLRKLLWADLTLLSDQGEINLIKKLLDWPRIVFTASEAHEPHRIAYYLQELAGEFHSLWNKGNDDPDFRFVIEGNGSLTLARLTLVKACSLIIAEGLELLGVEPLEEMH
ncbi:MAG: arginine--tRNA ligase [Sphingomonadales bacterium]